MEKYSYELFARFNQGANKQMNELILNLSEDDWNRQFPDYTFKSINELCFHTYIWDDYWMFKRISAIKEFKTFNSISRHTKYSLKDKCFDDKKEHLELRECFDILFVNLIDELTIDELNEPLRFTTSNGTLFEKRLGGLLLHLFNHESHHRAMISLFLESLGVKNDFNMILPFIN